MYVNNNPFIAINLTTSFRRFHHSRFRLCIRVTPAGTHGQSIAFVRGIIPANYAQWVPNVITAPAQKRAVAIALVNALGNSASIYGVFLWPKTDAPRYVPGFSATTVFIFAIGVVAQVMQYMVKKHPTEAPDPEAVIAAEIEKQRVRSGALEA
jgi:hypothetical protein